jgi:O-acetyl-ADP-ribose deacetylase (regulator of RNase III)
VIRIVLGSLEDAEAEAIVRPIRSDLTPVTVASRDVGAAAGPGMEERLVALGSLPVGGAVITPGGSLSSPFVIHVVVMSADQPQTAATVERALKNGLARAADWGISSLALPPLGLAAGLTEPEVAAETLVGILREHLRGGNDPLDLAIVATTSFEEELFTRLVGATEMDRSI